MIKEIKNGYIVKHENWTLIFQGVVGYAYRECGDTMRLYAIRDAKYVSYINSIFIPQLVEKSCIDFLDYNVVFHGDTVFIVKGGERIGRSCFVMQCDTMKFWKIVVEGFSETHDIL